MNTKETQHLMDHNNDTMLVDGFESAIIGLDTSSETFRVIYDREKMIDLLVGDEMSIEDAIEYLEYNVWNAYVGDGTPIYAYAGGHERILELMSQI